MRPRLLAAILMSALSLAACKAEERGHQVKLDKGSYTGPRDGEISDATRQALAARLANQSDGIDRLAAQGPIPTGEAPPAGRIAGQNY